MTITCADLLITKPFPPPTAFDFLKLDLQVCFSYICSISVGI